MNILYCSTDNSKVSGAFRSMVKLATIMKTDFGHNVIIVLPYKGDGADLLEETGIEYYIIRSFDWTIKMNRKQSMSEKLEHPIKQIINMIAVPRISKLIRDKNIDLVHVNTSWGYVGALSALKTNTRFIWHIREFLEEDQGRTIRNKEKGYALIKKANHVVAISGSIYRKYCKIISLHNLSVIMNGIDPEEFYKPGHIPLCSETVNILIVGKLSPSKGQEDAVKSCIEVYKKGFTNISLKIVGDGDENYTSLLSNIIEQENAGKYICLCGASSNVSQYYINSDIVLVCSKAEAFGRVTVEAMLSGALVIGANSGATKELIDAGKTGLLYTYGETSSLADNIIYAIENQDDMKKVAQAGQTFMLENMTAQANALKINNLYNKVMSEPIK